MIRPESLGERLGRGATGDLQPWSFRSELSACRSAQRLRTAGCTLTSAASSENLSDVVLPRATPEPRWPVSFFRDHRIEFDIAAQLTDPQHLLTDFDRHLVRYAPYLSVALPSMPPVLPVRDRHARVRTHAIRQVTILEVAGRLSDVVDDLDRAIQLALAESPRGVVCDLSAVHDARPVAVELLAMAGQHVRDWPGIPIAVACADPRVREALRADSLGRHLIVTASLFSAITSVLANPALPFQRLTLAAHPTAPRASREFVTRTLHHWQLGAVIPFASLVVGELVASSSINAGNDIDLSVSWNCGALRLTVRDHGPALPGLRRPSLDLHRPGLTVLAGLSRGFGVLPTADGGRVVWAVLEAPRQCPSTNNVVSNSKPEPVNRVHAVQPRSHGAR
jgi:hypothetical protein